LVKDALKEKAPQLYRSLSASGKLNETAQELADQISSQVVTLTQAQRAKEKWDQLGPVACAAKMKMADSINLELVLAQMLEFPQDETSQPKPDETTSSDPTT
jgi:hypothetical protein